jgi:murein DD-endopeptidase MepM/ murein hydrolase activator NlpD
MRSRVVGLVALIGLIGATTACVTAGASGSGAGADVGRPAPTTEASGTDSSPSPKPGRRDSAGGSDPEDRAAQLLGGCGLAPLDLRPKYVLPFSVGSGYELAQGNCGPHSHDGRFNFGFDFRMPMRTPIIAAREGVVNAVRESKPDGTGRIGDENYVIIDHGDGEYSRYIHLTADGALVSRGERVARGDTIALSGNSGRSAFPHLHFDVVDGCTNGVCWTIPAAFLNSDPPIPTHRGLYTARHF